MISASSGAAGRESIGAMRAREADRYGGVAILFHWVSAFLLADGVLRRMLPRTG